MGSQPLTGANPSPPPLPCTVSGGNGDAGEQLQYCVAFTVPVLIDPAPPEALYSTSWLDCS